MNIRANDISWQLAGLTTDSIFASPGWSKPAEIHLADGHLVYPMSWAGRVQATPGPELLNDFTGLSRAGGAVLAFAKRWGVLDLCEHGVPDGIYRHRREGAIGCAPLVGHDATTCLEPLDRWLDLAREAQSLLNIAARLNDNQSGLAADWANVPSAKLAAEAYEVARTGRLSSDANLGTRYDLDRAALASAITKWLVLADVRPRFSDAPGQFSLLLGGHGLFGALALKLMLAVSKTEGLAACAACGNFFSPGERRGFRSNKNHYCSSCGRRAAVRDATRRYEAKKRKGGVGNATT